MSALQSDPKAAMARYGHIDEMHTFMQSFMKLMGEHFTGAALCVSCLFQDHSCEDR
jgi:hypothetical protein